MFKLYFNKEKIELEISPLGNLMSSDITTDEVKKFNSCYYVCKDRKTLRKFAEQLKIEWLKEAEERVETLNNLKIKNKY